MEDAKDRDLRNQFGIKKATIALHDFRAVPIEPKVKQTFSVKRSRRNTKSNLESIVIGFAKDQNRPNMVGKEKGGKKYHYVQSKAKQVKVLYNKPATIMKHIDSSPEPQRDRKKKYNKKLEKNKLTNACKKNATNKKDPYEKIASLQEKVKKLENELTLEKERSRKERTKMLQENRIKNQAKVETKSQTLNRLLNEDEEYEKLKNNEIEAKTEAADLRYRLELLRKENDKLKMKSSQVAEDNTRLYNLHLKGENEKKKLKEELKLLFHQHEVDKENNTRLYNLNSTGENEKKKIKEELKLLVHQHKVDREKSTNENRRLKRDLENLFNRVKVAETQAKSSTDWKEKYQLLWQETRPYSNVINQPEADYLVKAVSPEIDRASTVLDSIDTENEELNMTIELD